MNNEYYGVASTPTDDFLAHYGIKGMKWGVRRAIVKGGEKALRRQYIKAQKKLAKLDKQAAKTATYKKRAIGMGIGAAAAGGLAAAGTKGVGRLVGGVGTAMQEGGYGASRLAGKYIKNEKIRNALKTAGAAVGGAGTAVKGTQSHINRWGNATHDVDIGQKAHQGLAAVGLGSTGNNLHKYMDSKGVGKVTVSNNTIARVGAGVIGAGLAAGAARNAYKAKTAQKKAQQFRTEMNKAFAGTKYANRTDRPASNQKKRKNRG